MHRLLTALAAILTLCVTGLHDVPAWAQKGAPEDIGQSGAPSPQTNDPLVVPPGVTRHNVDVENRPLIIEGDLQGNVKAINSQVTLRPGASIEGSLSIVGGGLSVQSELAGRPSLASQQQNALISNIHSSPLKKDDWVGGQIFLLLMGLAGGVIVLLAAPQATTRVSDTISTHPGPSLLMGSAAMAVLLTALTVSGIIMKTHSPLTLLYVPVLVGLVLVSVFLLMFGWLAGMRLVGDKLADRFGWHGIGRFYTRMALGLSLFFVVNVLLGGIARPLGAIGLLAEFALALMGIGAIVKTGFGRENDWLFQRFRRSAG